MFNKSVRSILSHFESIVNDLKEVESREESAAEDVAQDIARLEAQRLIHTREAHDVHDAAERISKALLGK